MKRQNRITFWIAILALVPHIPTAAVADLGKADVTEENSRTSGSNYAAWCSRNRIDCKVSFKNSRLIIDDGDGITASQVSSIYKEAICRQYRFGIQSCFPSQYDKDFYITYKSNSGSEKTAQITIKHQATADQFQRDLEIWFGSILRPIGPSLKIE